MVELWPLLKKVLWEGEVFGGWYEEWKRHCQKVVRIILFLPLVLNCKQRNFDLVILFMYVIGGLVAFLF